MPISRTMRRARVPGQGLPEAEGLLAEDDLLAARLTAFQNIRARVSPGTTMPAGPTELAN
jgi:hypothetical protein